MLTRTAQPTINDRLPGAAARLRRERTNAGAATIALALTASGAVTAFISDEISRLEPSAQKQVLLQMSAALTQAVERL